jgi:hypothetical protein
VDLEIKGFQRAKIETSSRVDGVDASLQVRGKGVRESAISLRASEGVRVRLVVRCEEGISLRDRNADLDPFARGGEGGEGEVVGGEPGGYFGEGISGRFDEFLNLSDQYQ